MGQDKSGAYLFLPDGEAEVINVKSPVILVFNGPVMSKVLVQLPNLWHMVMIYNTPGPDGLGVEIQNRVDISTVNTNYELSMQISSNIKNKDVFYTDLNGFQVTDFCTYFFLCSLVLCDLMFCLFIVLFSELYND